MEGQLTRCPQYKHTIFSRKKQMQKIREKIHGTVFYDAASHEPIKKQYTAVPFPDHRRRPDDAPTAAVAVAISV